VSNFKIERPYPGVLHLRFPDQESVARAMIRIEEFYESPHEALCGKAFPVALAEALHQKTHGDSYYEHWHGFNVPVDTVQDFFLANEGGDFSAAEVVIADVIRWDEDEYLIATHQDCDYDHELCHAFWRLLPAYKRQAEHLLASEHRCLPRVMERFESALLDKGYGREHMADEFNAYLSEGTHEYFVDELGLSHDDATVLVALRDEHERLLRWVKEWKRPGA
jgi:hypothetical protein